MPFLELTLKEIQRTVTRSNVDVLVIVADPADNQMAQFLVERGVRFKHDTINRGFASNVNDGYDAAFKDGDYDYLICCGNDVVVMPGAIDAMIETADSTDFQMICGSEFNAQFLVGQYPEARQFFRGDDLIFNDFNARPWELHKDFRDGIEPDCRKDIRNLALFKRNSWEVVGYDEVNMYPNAYFSDNDYGRRCDLLSVSAAGLKQGAFFHFTSRTIRQNAQRDHGKFFSRNGGHYAHKWGGGVGNERYAQPYDGRGFQLSPEIFLAPDMKISSRDQEDAIIDYWSNLR